MLAAGEIVTGSLLLAPFVSNLLAGCALTGFSGSLLAYARTPALRKPDSVWPTRRYRGEQDVWMLGIGLGLLADARASAGGADEPARGGLLRLLWSGGRPS